MRILLANDARAGGGGVESYLASLSVLLRQRGHDLALLHAGTARDHGPTTFDVDREWGVGEDGLGAAIASAESWRPDVVLSHNMNALDIEEAALDRWPVVKMMHGYFGTCVSARKTMQVPRVTACSRVCGPACLIVYAPRGCGTLRPSTIARDYRWSRRQRGLLPRYRTVVVASDHMRREYLRHGVDGDRVQTIPLFAPPAIPQAARTNDVLFLGRMTDLKGADLLLAACREGSRILARTVTLTAAGEGPLRAGLRHPTDGVVVQAPGWVGEEQKRELLASSRVVIIPSRWPEPFGLVGLEAAAAGTPVVAFDTGGISTWLRDRENGLLVDPRSGAAGLGRAIAQVLSDENGWRRFAAGAAACAARFSADAHAAALERVLDDGRARRACVAGA
jgi:glycosyltransferase involved in cell wall biosynthesis